MVRCWWGAAERLSGELVWLRCLDFGCGVGFGSRVDGGACEGSIARSGGCRGIAAQRSRSGVCSFARALLTLREKVGSKSMPLCARWGWIRVEARSTFP